MKKKSIITVILLGIVILLFNNKAMAASSRTPILGYLECDYKISKVYASDGPIYVHGGVITFGYTELTLSSDPRVANRLYVRTYDENLEPWQLIDPDWSNAWQFGFPNTYDATGSTVHLEEMNNTFRRILMNKSQNTDFSCPKYLILQESEDSSYIPRFSNTIEEYCGPTMSCLVFGELMSSSKDVLYGNEKGWEYNFDSDAKEDCKDLKLKLYLDAPNTNLKASISYPSYSSFFDDSAGREVSADVEISDGSLSFEYIHNLISKNQISLMKINGNSGAEKVILDDSKECDNLFCWGGNKYCTLSNQTFTEAYTCESYANVKAELNDKATKFNELFKKYTKIAQDNLDFNGKVGVTTQELDIQYYSAKDYSDYSDSAELNKKVEELESYINSHENDEVVMNEYISGLKSKENSLCTDEQIVMQNDKAKATESFLTTQKWLELMTQSVENIKQRLLELGDSTGAEKADVLLDKLNSTITQIQHYYEVSKTISFIKGSISLNFEDDCGIITTKLKQWLIRGLDILKVVALVLTLILGMIDFFRGLASGNADTMKKVWTSFSRRLIVVVILFLLPVILEFVLGVINIEGVISTDPLCGIK